MNANRRSPNLEKAAPYSMEQGKIDWIQATATHKTRLGDPDETSDQ
jgi:hypothetical protein